MQLTITRPDDWHLHLRDGAHMAAVVRHTAERFGRAIVMPNLKPPVTTAAQARAYHDRIVAALPPDCTFQPLMTLYLTDNTPPAEIDRAKTDGVVHAVKYYPAGATTNSDSGVTAIERCFATLARMEELDLPFLLHGEVTDSHVDVFDREAAFIDRILADLVRRFPRLRIVFEHVTTREAVQFVASCGPNVAATITPQHLLLNRNAMFQGGIRPHHYCLPVPKRARHRDALLDAVTRDNRRFFLGTDSAPHARGAKEAACGCAGVYTARDAIGLYAEAFARRDALSQLAAFASELGPVFYGLPVDHRRLRVVAQEVRVPASLPFGADELVPFRAGEVVRFHAARVA